jgi:RNA polymerase primary sigma factor
MQTYMASIARYPLITKDREAALARRIAAGDEGARDELICANLRLVVKIAHDYRGRGLPLEDLVSEGNSGLARAADRFDPAKGAKFSTYASWWIKQSMRRALANQSRTIRVPLQAQSKMALIRRTEDSYSQEGAGVPTDAELAARSGLSEQTVSMLRTSYVRLVSLDAPLSEGNDRRGADLIADPQAPDPAQGMKEREARAWLGASLRRLPERERCVIAYRFGLAGRKPQTLDQLSRTIGLTRERVRQIQNEALGTLRGLLTAGEDAEARLSA